MIKVYLGMGSNLGDPVAYLKQGLAELQKQTRIKVLATACVYKTEPIGYQEQDWFANTVIEVETSLTPQELLQVLQVIENHLGRERTIRWGPRTLDLDILLYGEEVINNPDLEIPHPRIAERAFVVAPLAELAPELTLGGKNIKELANSIVKQQKITCTKEKLC
ncbi:MAG: 2-amino-4-hydroxy-6-hydroxymethyldihydropteridine diphosphokinase [Thermincolia bacterium]